MWDPVDKQFFAPRLPVEIAQGVDAWWVKSIRSFLEEIRCVTLLHSTIVPTDFLKVIDRGATAPEFLTIYCHGHERGLRFHERYTDEIDVSMLAGKYMPAAAIREHVNLPGCTVQMGACCGGTDEMVSAFMSGGVTAFMGSPVAIGDQNALHMFTVHFYYAIIHRRMSVRDAWRCALDAVASPALNAYAYHGADGTDETP